MAPGLLRQQADGLLELVESDPQSVRDRSVELAQRAERSGDRGAAAAALRAAGVAERLLTNPRAALELFDRAIELASQDVRLQDLVRVSRAAALHQIGDVATALAQVDQARHRLTDGDRAFADYQYAALLARAGRTEEAVTLLDDTIVRLEANGQLRYLAGAMTNRGLQRCYAQDLDRAVDDLTRARALYEDLGLHVYSATALHNLGYAQARRGDIIAAVEIYERARVEMASVGMRPAGLEVEHAEVLAEAGLVEEAVDRLGEVVRDLERAEDWINVAEAELSLAEQLLVLGRQPQAARHAKRARELFVAQRREGWSGRARLVELAAQAAAAGPGERIDSDVLSGLVVELTHAGHIEPAWRAELLLLDVGTSQRPPTSKTMNAVADLAARASDASVGTKLAIGELLARLHESSGDLAAAEQTSLAALELLEVTPAPDVFRAYRTFYARRTFARTRSLAARRNDPGALHDAFERTRTTAMRTRPGASPAAPAQPRPPRPPSVVGSEPPAPAPPPMVAPPPRIDASALVRMTPSAAPTRLARPVRLDELAETLGHRTLIEAGEVDGRLIAIVLTNGAASSHDVGDYDDWCAIANASRASMSLLARAPSGQQLVRAARDTIGEAVAQLARSLVDLAASSTSLVLALPAPITSLPLHCVPEWRSMPIVLTPSLTTWRERERAPRLGEGRGHWVGLVGPLLDHGVEELESLRRLGLVECESTRAATRNDVLDALASDDDLHLVAHIRVRPGNPLLSFVELADGPLALYEIETAGPVRGRVVLSACDAGQSLGIGADEQAGIAASLLRLGATSVIAPWAPTADHAGTVEFMTALHRQMETLDHASALVAAKAHLDPDDAVGLSLLGTFTCFGNAGEGRAAATK